jgi:hypothetical protein
MVDQKKIIYVGLFTLAFGGIIFLPKMLSKKQVSPAEEDDVVSMVQKSPRNEELLFEKESSRNKSFEELTPQEKAELYTQTVDLAQQVAQDAARQAVADEMKEQREILAKQQARQAQNNVLPQFSSANNPPTPLKWHNDAETQKLLDKDFSAATDYYREQAKHNKWATGDYHAALLKSNNTTRAIDRENMDLFDMNVITTSTTHTIPAGTYLTAITTGITDSDYPEAFVATMSRPSILRGWKLLCKSGGNNAGRVSITCDRLISPEGKEISVSGQVEMASIPGVTGQKHSRWLKRMAPSIINAGIGGGLLAYQMRQEQKDREAWSVVGGTGTVTTPVGTVVSPEASSTKQITEPMIQDGIGGLQKEITRSFNQGNTNDQVIIHGGTVFDILLLSALTIKI